MFTALITSIGLVAGGLELHYRHQAEAAPLVIGTDYGGGISDYVEMYEKLRWEKRKVVVDGTCISACTLVLGTIPSARLCVTEFARFAFHSAWRDTILGPLHSPQGTRFGWSFYPERVKKVLREHGFDGDDAEHNEHKELIYIDGRELANACEPT